MPSHRAHYHCVCGHVERVRSKAEYHVAKCNAGISENPGLDMGVVYDNPDYLNPETDVVLMDENREVLNDEVLNQGPGTVQGQRKPGNFEPRNRRSYKTGRLGHFEPGKIHDSRRT